MQNYTSILLTLLVSFQFFAQSLEETAETKIIELNSLITQAKSQGITTLKEEMSVRTAEVFLLFANWDENNIAVNEEDYKKNNPQPTYIQNKRTASELAEYIPTLQREEVILLLDNAKATLQQLLDGNIVRKALVAPEWDKMNIEGARVVQNGRPIFGYDWNGKPATAGPYNVREFFGSLSGFYFHPNFVQSDGAGGYELKKWVVDKLATLSTGNFGTPFLGQNGVPQALQDIPNIKDGASEFTGFDVDHPEARKLHKALFKGIIPTFKDKNSGKLGIMLTNEPHWNISGTWSPSDFSQNTRNKLATWLNEQHGAITTLNTRWNKSFSNFQEAANSVEFPIDAANRGNAFWYDLMRFNEVRITDWFTFLHDEIQSNAPTMKTHIKLIPGLWSGNSRHFGLDFEALTALTEIIGNDASMVDSLLWGTAPWQDVYAMDWISLAMSYDFMHSVNPTGINYNSESHVLSTGRFSDAFLAPEYVRASHWLATIHGMDVSTTWAWRRAADGSAANASFPNGGVVTQQPRVLNEVHATVMDINSYALEMSELQEKNNPIRFYYSETSAINMSNYMSKTQDLYESVYFNGHRLGFVTENIIKKQANNWGVVVVTNSEYVLESEIDALQLYLNNGGTILLDAISLKKDQYGRAHTKLLNASSGVIIRVNSSNVTNTILSQANAKGYTNPVEVTETNEQAVNFKGVQHRSIITSEGKRIVSLINLGITEATVDLSVRDFGSSEIVIIDLLKGTEISNAIKLSPEQVAFLEVKKAVPEELSIENSLSCIGINGEGVVKLNYQTATGIERDIHIDIQDLSDFKGVGKSKITVTGKGEVTIDTKSNKELVENGAYRLNIYMTEKGKNFNSTVVNIDGGISLIASVSCDNSLSVEGFNKTKENDIVIYPNPFNEKINISVSGQKNKEITAFNIIDVNGHVVAKSLPENDLNIIETDQLSNGVYFLEVKYKGANKEVFKVIK